MINNQKFYILHNGTIGEHRMMDCPEADSFANKNGHLYVERLVNAYPNGTMLVTDQHDRIKRIIPVEQNRNDLEREKNWQIVQSYNCFLKAAHHFGFNEDEFVEIMIRNNGLLQLMGALKEISKYVSDPNHSMTSEYEDVLFNTLTDLKIIKVDGDD